MLEHVAVNRRVLIDADGNRFAATDLSFLWRGAWYGLRRCRYLMSFDIERETRAFIDRRIADDARAGR